MEGLPALGGVGAPGGWGPAGLPRATRAPPGSRRDYNEIAADDLTLPGLWGASLVDVLQACWGFNSWCGPSYAVIPTCAPQAAFGGLEPTPSLCLSSRYHREACLALRDPTLNCVTTFLGTSPGVGPATHGASRDCYNDDDQKMVVPVFSLPMPPRLEEGTDKCPNL